jgi:hypothetical protein
VKRPQRTKRCRTLSRSAAAPIGQS